MGVAVTIRADTRVNHHRMTRASKHRWITHILAWCHMAIGANHVFVHMNLVIHRLCMAIATSRIDIAQKQTVVVVGMAVNTVNPCGIVFAGKPFFIDRSMSATMTRPTNFGIAGNADWRWWMFNAVFHEMTRATNNTFKAVAPQSRVIARS